VGSTIAWTFNERGVRNIYVAEGPAFEARRITSYTEDDGQELTQLSFSKDGRTIVYVRGGDHGSRPGEVPPNPAESPVQPKVQIWSISLDRVAPRLLADGDNPVIAPNGFLVTFVREVLREKRIWTVPIDGSKDAQPLFYARGASDSPVWSPDGRTLAFVSDRTDHSFIGLYTPDQPIRFIAPSTSRDSAPQWSSDGRKIVFLRQPGLGSAPRPPAPRAEPSPWEILIADVAKPEAQPAVAVGSGAAPVDPIIQNPGGITFRWAADDHLVVTLYRDGFPHVYSIQHPGAGGKPVLLTPGRFMVEQMALSSDGRFVIYSANTGADRSDIDRRHLFKVPVNAPTPTPLTTGNGIEWSPVITGDGQTVAFLSTDAQRPPAPTVIAATGGAPRVLARNRLAADFPANQLVTPELVSFRAADGVEAYGQLFKPSGGAARKPAVVYVHGGGPRQMLLGWHTRWEYANDYGANQYLASRGFIVLSVDYRLSVGYGEAFQFPEYAGPRGASEYQDVLAGGRYLQSRPDVDPNKIGIWGASLGGYLTALGLGRNSEVFAAGVDVHGAHDRIPAITTEQLARAIAGDGVTESELRQSVKVAYDSSPIAAVATWKSPVLMIHGDDDRTVNFRQTIDLRRRLLEKGVRVEELVLPDDVHDSLLWRNWTKSISAMARFFEQELKGGK
jgi:dipeptidyl aminopeptidase/acylaminoacyl peptidase